MTFPSTTSTGPRPSSFATGSPRRRMRRASCPGAGSFACRPKHNGNTRAGPERRRRPLSATRSAANRGTFSATNRTTGPRLGPRSIGRQKSGAFPPTRGACMTCTATSSNGVAIGFTRACRAAQIPICRTLWGARTARATTQDRDAAAALPILAGPAARRSDSGSSLTDATTILAFAPWPSGCNYSDPVE
jgi:hypothetical protein